MTKAALLSRLPRLARYLDWLRLSCFLSQSKDLAAEAKLVSLTYKRGRQACEEVEIEAFLGPVKIPAAYQYRVLYLKSRRPFVRKCASR